MLRGPALSAADRLTVSVPLAVWKLSTVLGFFVPATATHLLLPSSSALLCIVHMHMRFRSIPFHNP